MQPFTGHNGDLKYSAALNPTNSWMTRNSHHYPFKQTSYFRWRTAMSWKDYEKHSDITWRLLSNQPGSILITHEELRTKDSLIDDIESILSN